ncbi:glycosyl hydrolase family 76-domain-containing protein [Coniella lustricola]|uniref:mannan endo-1,6-alpha-mannosidase n=1 Tax=Coniella lustricola TaxID=2025994 RepID=A0A2T3ALE3_9PEZI|nr:glycosyl hydrolase family 76-domain-containing protein [Coniella lustricola]
MRCTQRRPIQRCKSGIKQGTWVVLSLSASQFVASYTLDPNSQESILSVAADMVDDMMTFYHGNEPGQVPGLLPQPYYWWEGGALMGALIDYWYYTGDDQWNDIVQRALLFQVGPQENYMPPNQTMTEGNDDQGFWGMTVLSAAEYNFPNPPPDQPQWLALAESVFSSQAARWDTADCSGGLRWQIFQWNDGFNYKNSISQACFFNMAARLALYTGLDIYAEWANRTWDWMIGTGLMTEDTYHVYDGAHIADNCTDITPYQWTYNAGAFLLGAAAMYNYTAANNYTESKLWQGRVDGLLNGSRVFFIGDEYNVMSEVACESVHLCDNDQMSFKAYLSRWMAATTKWAPWTYNTVKPLLAASAEAAAQQCTGGDNGRMCGLMWANNSGKWDGTMGPGQQMAAMEAVLANMIEDIRPPVTNTTGGTSVGKPSTGQDGPVSADTPSSSTTARSITLADRVGSWLLTLLAIACLISCMHFCFGCAGTSQPYKRRQRDGRANGYVRSMMQTVGLWDRPRHSERPRAVPQEDGPRTPVSEHRGKSPAPPLTVFSVEIYPNEQPWRRQAREGDFAGAIDPNRGDGAGFGILDFSASAQKTTAEEAPAISSTAASSSKHQLRDVFVVGAAKAHEIKMKAKLRLEKKPLPGMPGLGRRSQGSAMDDNKVWGTLI